MIPTRLIRLDAIPRTATGKIDRQLLSAGNFGDGTRSATKTLARDELERTLVDVLEDVLQVAPIGVDDDLFELGTDSLTAVELFVAIEKDLGIELSIGTIWSEAQTVAELVEVVRNARDGVRKSADRTASGPSRVGRISAEPLFALRDLSVMALLLLLLLIRRVVPAPHWSRTTRALAALVTWSLPWRTQATVRAIGHVLGDRRISLTNRGLADEIQWVNFERRLLSLGGWYPDAASPPVALEGREHIDRALERGKGIILWRASLAFNSMAARLALNRLGYHLYNVGRPEHGATSTKFGRHLLSLLCKDDQRLKRELIIIRGDGQEAVDQIRRRLAENQIVSIRAGSQTDNPIDLPFLRGRLSLPAGPPRLALATGAALLPVFTIREGDGAFRVFVEPPLEANGAADTISATNQLQQRFVARLETYVLRDPALWPDWRRSAVDDT